MNKHTPLTWELKSHSYQIADTADYEGHYEITNGKITLVIKDDIDDEQFLHLELAYKALNDARCDFYCREVNFLSLDLSFERAILKNLRKQNAEMLEALKMIAKKIEVFNGMKSEHKQITDLIAKAEGGNP